MNTRSDSATDRRTFLRTTVAVGGLAALAGCSLVGGKAPPPRKSNAIAAVEVQNGQLRIDLADQPWVESRKDATASTVTGFVGVSSLLAAASPVGRAAAKGKGGGGRGATGRGTGGYSSAPRTSKDRAKYHGGAYGDDWRENHEDEVERYRASIAAAGVAYLGRQAEFEDDKPGAGPVPWDQQFENPEDVYTYPVERPGWYRVGTRLQANDGTTDFGWEAVDVLVDDEGTSTNIEETWKVSPRL